MGVPTQQQSRTARPASCIANIVSTVVDFGTEDNAAFRPRSRRPTPDLPPSIWSSRGAAPSNAKASITVRRRSRGIYATTPTSSGRPPRSAGIYGRRPHHRDTQRAPKPTELQTQLDTFADEYNHRRPHCSLPNKATPATAYSARHKVSASPSQGIEHHQRVHADRVDGYGSLTLRVETRCATSSSAGPKPEQAFSGSCMTSTPQIVRASIHHLTIDPTTD